MHFELVLVLFIFVILIALLYSSKDHRKSNHFDYRSRQWDPDKLPLMFSIDSSFRDERILPITEKCIERWRSLKSNMVVSHGEISSGALIHVQPRRFLDSKWTKDDDGDSFGYTRLFISNGKICSGEIYINDEITKDLLSDQQLESVIYKEVGCSLGISAQ